MNYELVKQLKHAGYEGTFLLGELIESCKTKPNEYFYLGSRPSNTWVAFMHPKINSMVSAEGDTAEETVAKLWLALNKK